MARGTLQAGGRETQAQTAPNGAVKPFLAALAGTVAPRPPFWLMRQAGRYLPEYRELRASTRDFLDFCYTPEKASEATLQPIRRFAMDAAIIFSDILVIPHALGMPVRFEQGHGPVLEPLADARAVARLDPARVREHLEPVYEALRLTARALPEECALIGFAGAPWTVATYMLEGGSSRGFARSKRWAYGDPGTFEALVSVLVESTADHLCAQVEAGAEAVQIFDSWAGVLPDAAFRRWAVAPVAEIVRRVKARHPLVPVIGFPRGAGVLYRGYAEATGVDVVSLDTAVPTAWARDRIQPGVVVQGNLDPQMLVVGGTAMEREVARILGDLSAGPYVFNLGHGVVPETPPDHVARLADLIRGWSRGEGPAAP